MAGVVLFVFIFFKLFLFIICVAFLQSPSDEVKAAVRVALEAGYRQVDTAFVYQNEAAIGEVLNEWIESGKIKREELFITTKVSVLVITYFYCIESIIGYAHK